MTLLELSIKRAEDWIANPAIDAKDKSSTQKLLNNISNEEAKKELIENFYKDLEFGTGGIRGILGMGLNLMNRYNVRRASYALAKTVCESFPQIAEKKIAISYDSRHFSFDFAKEASCVFAHFNIKSLIYERMNPVALLSFLVRSEGAQAGIMVTASHNPAKYNGYKVYWDDGAQVTPPYDAKIIDAYNDQKDYGEIKDIPFEMAKNQGLISWIGKEVEDRYFKLVEAKTINPLVCKKEGRKLHIIYSPLHGTGLLPCSRILSDIGFSNLSIVEEQARPDGNFPTVSRGPNPENPEALALAVELLKKKNADIVFATDPDTDRLGVAIIDQGKVFYPNGNQIGMLMMDYIFKERTLAKLMPTKGHVVKTIVTTRMLDLIAKKYGVEVYNTLTGFKWICKEMNEIESRAKATGVKNEFIFATEESFGYMHHNYVRDKDAVSSIALMAEVALYHKLQGANLQQALDKIYEEYGLYHESLLSLDYFGKEGAEKINRIMDDFRRQGLSTICNEVIIDIEDYQNQTMLNLKSAKVSKITLPKSNVIGLSFEAGHRLYLRPSGTEPKIKFYIMILEKNGNLKEKKEKAAKKALEFEIFIKERANKA